VPKKKVSYIIKLNPEWVEQTQAFKEIIEIINENIKKKEINDALEDIEQLIQGTLNYLSADIEITGRTDRHHQTFIKQLIDLHLVKDYLLNLTKDEQRAQSFVSILSTFRQLKNMNLTDEIILFSHDLVKQMDSVSPKQEELMVQFLSMISTFGLYCLEFQLVETSFFFDYVLDYIAKNKIPFSESFLTAYIGKCLIFEGNQKYDAALAVYRRFLDHVLETSKKYPEWWAKIESSKNLFLLKEAFFFTYIYAFYESDKKTMTKAYLNFPGLNDRTNASRIIRLLMASAEIAIKLQETFIEASSFEDIYAIFDNIYLHSNLKGWDDRRVELKHVEASDYLPRIINKIMEGKPKYGIIIIESPVKVSLEKISLLLNGKTLAEIPVQPRDSIKSVELGGITFSVDKDSVQVFAETLDVRKANELTVKYLNYPEYRMKLSFSGGGLIVYNLLDLLRDVKLNDGGIEYLGRIWSRSETITDLVRAVGKLPKKTFMFKYEADYRHFCRDFGNVLKKAGQKSAAKILANMYKQEFFTGESVRLVIVQRLSELAFNSGTPAEELDTIAKEIVLRGKNGK